MRYWVLFCVRVGQKTIKDGVTDLASSIAFFICFGIFPFLLAVISAAAMWMDRGEVKAQFQRFLVNAIPQGTDAIMSQVEYVLAARGSMGVAGVVALLWSASSAFGAISRSLNRAQGMPKSRNYLISRIRYFLMAAAVSLLIIVSVAISGALEFMVANEQWLKSLLGVESSELNRAAVWATTFSIMVLAFMLIYRSAPYERLAWRHIWPGALLAAISNEAAKFGFLWYITHIAHFELVFGSLTGIMMFLLWLYIAGIALVVGFEFNLVLAGDSDH